MATLDGYSPAQSSILRIFIESLFSKMPTQCYSIFLGINAKSLWQPAET
jgi:hypothetical protein